MHHVARYLIPPLALAFALVLLSDTPAQPDPRQITPELPKGGKPARDREWQRIEYEAPDPPPSQPDRVLIPPGNSIAYDPIRDILYLVGGGDTGGMEAWRIRLAGESAELQFVPALNPPHSAAIEEVIYDPVGNRLIVFGLFSGDVWVLSLDAPASWGGLDVTGPLPRTRKDFSVVYDAPSHRLLLYGGLYLYFYNDTWELPLGGSLQWRRLEPPLLDSMPLVKRFDHRAIYDAPRGRMIVFGGQIEPNLNETRPYCRDDAWQLIDGNPPRWQRYWTGGPTPAKRRNPIVIHDTNRDRMIVMGGNCYADFWNDAFALDLATAQWSPFPAIPSGLRSVLWDAIYDPIRDRFLFHAGWSDFWQLKADGSSAWEVFPTAVSPAPIAAAAARAFGTMIHDPVRNRFLVFGGEGSVPGDLEAFHDVFAFELDDPARATAVEAPNGPAARYYHAAIYEPVRDEMIVYGGQDFPTIYSDLWALSLAGTPAWRKIEPLGETPPLQREPVMTYDSRRARLLLLAEGEDLGHIDVWTLDLREEPRWLRAETLGDPPSPRRFASVAYDPAHDRLVVTGGWDKQLHVPLDDIWTLSFRDQGTAKWSRIKIPPNEPRPFGGTSHAYDAAKNRLVLSGAWDEHGVRHDQVWALSLDGRPEWKLLHSGGSDPGIRFGEQIAVDPDGNRLLAFGGRTSNPFAYWDDLWALPLATRPSAPGVTSLPGERSEVALLSSNPVRDHLRVRLSLPVPGDVVLDVFDVRGHILERRVLNSMPAGSREIELHGIRKLPSGVYFLRVTQRGETFIERFVLLR